MARGSRLARLAALGLLGVVTLTGCDVPNNEFWRFGWPDGITKQSQDMRELWTGSVIAALIVGFARLGPDPLVGRPAPEALRRAAASRRRTTCRWRSSTRSCRS